MKVIAISDTHCKLSSVSFDDVSADILIHAGDLTMSGSLKETAKELFILGGLRQKFKNIVLISGNHDFLAERDPLIMKNLCEDNGVIYLQDSFTILNNIKFYGAAWTPFFQNWAFNRRRGNQIRRHWELIPDDVDVLITHGPVYGIHDQVENEKEHLGCRDLLDEMLRVKPKVHVCGHIHSGYGVKFTQGTTYINASLLDESYKLKNKPIAFEI